MNLLLILYALRKDLIEMRNALFFKVEDAKNFAFFGLRQYPAMLSSILATTSDRVLLGIFGKPAKLSDYGVSNKIPETLRYLVLPITYPMLPDLTHAFQEGKAALESRFKHDTLIALAAGCAGIMIPCAMSRPVLMLWLGRHTPTEAPLVSAFMGVYCALEIYYAALVAATYAADKPQLCIPFSTWNGLATAGFTVPAYLFFGIQGVGALNMMINLVQFVPLIWWVRRGVGLQEWMRAYMGVAIKTLLLSAVFSLTGFFLAHLLSERGYIWVGVLLIPIWCVLFTVVVLYFRLAYLPESIRMAAEKILSAFKDRFRKNSSEKAPVA
jgi:O-antigen/teichoic acid export membrane protein